MKKLLLFYVLPILLISTSGATAQNITLGPQVMTFPEIAQKLSIEGRIVECTEDLYQLAAFVSLKNRSWEDTIKLLSKGLQVKFVKVEGKKPYYVMHRDARILERDQKWLSLFARRIQTSMQEKMNLYASYGNLPEDQAKEKLLELQAEYDKLPAKLRSSNIGGDIGEPESPSEVVDTRLVDKAHNLSDGIHFLKSPTRRFYYEWLSNNVASLAEIEETIKKGEIFHLRKLDDISLPALNPLIPYLKTRYPDFRAESYDYLAGSIRFNSWEGGLSFSPRISIIAPDQQPLFREFNLGDMFDYSNNNSAGTSPIDFVFEGSRSAAGGKKEGLGKDAVKWLASERKQTLEFLKQEKAKEVVKVKKDGLPVNDLSQCIESWSAATDSEAMMELYPMQDRVIHTSDGLTEFSLAHLYDPKSSVWSFIESDHVLMVNNRLSFLDRWCNFPTSALIHLERKSDKTGMKNRVDFNYESLSAYSHEVTGGSISLWTEHSEVLYYRGINTMSLDKTLGAMFLWERLSKSERARLLSEARKEKNGYSSMPLSRFSIGELSSLHAEFQKWGVDNGQALHPHHLELLATCFFGVRFLRSPDPTSYEVRLSINPPEGSGIMVWGAEATFLWKP